MSGVARSVFGGGKQSSSTRDRTPQELAALRQPFSQVGQALLGQGNMDPLQGIPTYQGQFAAGMAPNESALLQQLMGQGQGAQQLINQTLSGQFLQQGNPFLEQAIQAAQRPTLQGLEEMLSRTLPGRFTQAGQFVQPEGSSPFDRAAAIATRGAADAMGDIATNMGFASHEAERGRMQEAIQLDQQQLQSTIQNLQAQALPRMIEQLGLDRGLQEFDQRVNRLLQTLQIITGAPLVNLGTESRGSNQGPMMSPIGTSPITLFS
jgi:hypothetical protein